VRGSPFVGKFCEIEVGGCVSAPNTAPVCGLAGAEDAFVTSVYALMQNAQQSRFHVTALPFIERLAEEANYLEQLRGVWDAISAS
jgi:hypothetical protein